MLGCGSGVLAALIVAGVWLSARKRRFQSGKGLSGLPDHSPVGAPQRRTVGSARGRAVATHSNEECIPSFPPAEQPSHTEPGGLRRIRAWHWFTVTAASILVIVVAYFGIAFEKQTKKAPLLMTRSETARRIMQERFDAERRARVRLTEATVQPLSPDGGGFTITLQNTGETAALDLQVSAGITLEDDDQPAGLQKPNITAHCSAGTLMPGAVYTTNVWFRTSSDAMYGLTHDQLRAVNFIRISYEDVLQRSNAAEACFYWRSSLSAVKPCEGNNELN
jgi:hypothetical protein